MSKSAKLNCHVFKHTRLVVRKTTFYLRVPSRGSDPRLWRPETENACARQLVGDRVEGYADDHLRPDHTSAQPVVERPVLQAAILYVNINFIPKMLLNVVRFESQLRSFVLKYVGSA